MFLFIGIQNVEGIAIDWVYNNIYFTDQILKTVSVASLNNTALRRVLIRDTLHPRAIALDPLRCADELVVSCYELVNSSYVTILFFLKVAYRK